MSFRWRLFLGVGLAVLLTAAVYGFLGYFAFKGSLDSMTSDSFQSFKQAALASWDMSGEHPTLALTDSSRAVFAEYSTSRFRLVRANEPPYEVLGAFPQTLTGWLYERQGLEDGYTLEIAFNTTENQDALRSYIQTTLAALPVALGLAVLFAFLLQRIFMRPIKDLQRATQQLSLQAIPEPIAIPQGKDELSQLAESFNRMTASLQAFIERERSFTRYASHELRTPLANMRVLVEGMQRGITTPEEAYPHLEDTMKRMEGILSGLLTLTRSPQLTPEPVMLENVVKQVMNGLCVTEQTRVRFQQIASPVVLGREDLLRQIVANLIHNALKYSAESVEVRLEESANEARLIVRDYGTGVPSEALEKLTDPFFRVDKRKGGSGLGLALVKHIVTSLKGTLLLCNSHPGLEATVTLPKANLGEVKATKDTKELSHA
jgi:signal transduction histidine kinase